jgi:hypothetical protein
MKRAFVQAQGEWAQSEWAWTPPVHEKETAAQEFRNQLFLWNSLGEMDAGKLCIIAYYCTQIGGQGLEDLSVNPKYATKNGSALVKLVKGKTFQDPELYYCNCPMFDKKAAERTSCRTPLRLPSSIFTQYFKDYTAPTLAIEPRESSERFDCPAYHSHPVVVRDWAVLNICLRFCLVSFNLLMYVRIYIYRH